MCFKIIKSLHNNKHLSNPFSKDVAVSDSYKHEKTNHQYLTQRKEDNGLRYDDVEMFEIIDDV